MRPSHALAVSLGCAALASCHKIDARGDDARGLGLAEAPLTTPQVARVYASAMRSAFDIGPDLTLLLQPTLLPRWSGYEGGLPVPAELRAAIERGRLVKGECAPVRSATTRAPVCDASRAGYAVRISSIFQRPGDTVLVYLRSEVYAAKGGPGQQPFSFEMAYQLVPRGEDWRVVREGRVRQEGRQD